MDFDLTPLLEDNRLVVHCPDRDVAIAFVQYIKDRYPSRYFKGYPGKSEYWDNHKEKMCYLPRLERGPSMQYADLEYYSGNGYEIISIYDLMHGYDIGPFAVGEVDIKSLFGME